jgi:porphobilinogen synthase
MPGQFQLSIDTLIEEAQRAWSLGIRAVVLFGIPAHKDPLGSENYDPHGIIPEAIRALKQALPEMVVVSDLCMCEYTDHGHCGIINTPDTATFDPHLPTGYVLNDPTLDYLGRTAVVHARAGADIIAPSGMMDGMVAAIRSALDDAGFEHIPIMSYAAKYASALYGPFRDAAESPPAFGDRSQYQMDPANAREALREVQLDIAEGADIIMVKPASFYLDILARLKTDVNLPLAAYQVSGEYAMIKAAAANGWIDEPRVMLESLLSIKRAGADLILTYFAMDAAELL